MCEAFWIMISAIASAAMAVATFITIIISLKQNREAAKKVREERQPYIIPTIECISGAALANSNFLRVQLNFHCSLENVGDSTAVSVYAFLYARMQYTQEKRMVYAHLLPKYNYSICVGKAAEKDIHFETDQFRDILEDLEISQAKNIKRIETNPYQESYKGPEIILRVLYKNMMGQWFESELVQELLKITYMSKDENDRGEMVANKDVSDGDIYSGYMINPCYSHINRRMVSDDYVKEVLKDCAENAETSRFEIEKCV